MGVRLDVDNVPWTDGRRGCVKYMFMCTCVGECTVSQMDARSGAAIGKGVVESLHSGEGECVGMYLGMGVVAKDGIGDKRM